MRIFIAILVSLYSLFWLGGCTSAALRFPYGLNNEHAGYVPARTAVFPCSVWPSGARYASLPLNHIDKDAEQKICEKFDAFVIDGFKDQPYMRGFSPTWVRKLLQDSQASDLLTQIDSLWANNRDSCVSCQTPAAFYLQTIRHRSDWLLWLDKISKSARNADAVLLPFILYSYETSTIDRGVNLRQRGAALAMLLIDTNTGNLLWSGGREAFANNRQFPGKASTPNTLEYPSWDIVFDRLLTEDLWRDFPGRQVYQ